MRVNERTIRDVLRSEAARVVPPPELWERIERELDRDRLGRTARAARRRAFGLRQVVVAALAVGALWFVIAPARPAVRQVALSPGRWADIDRTWVAVVVPVARSEAGRPAVTDLRWSSQEITLLR